MEQELKKLLTHAKKQLRDAHTADAIGALEVSLLGRKGAFAQLAKKLKGVAAAERPKLGKLVNETKHELSSIIRDARERLDVVDTGASALDLTIPGIPPPQGHLHPVSLMMHRVWDVFAGMGYALVDGPEVELDEYNFTRLNFLPGHPALDMQDTFYLDEKQHQLLRTHTTSVTLGRELQKRTPPFQILATGKCFRRDEDTTHTPMFHQFDGIAVGEHITFADLRGTLETAMRRILDQDVEVRFRVSYFPFTEPSAEFDIAFTKAAGKQRSWLEMGGCGMIHPNVLKMAGHDPEKVTGLAFGFGIERPFMIKHGVPDLRLFFQNDLQFLEQF